MPDCARFKGRGSLRKCEVVAELPEIQIIPDPINGHQLVEFINTPKLRRKAIVEGLVYEKSCLMIASHPGIGKSILTIQMCLEISAGLPVFGAFKSTPTKIYYIQKERPLDEVAERVEEMQKSIPWNRDNFMVDSELQVFSLSNEKNHKWIIDRIARFEPGLIVIDPIGAGTPGLSKDEPANIFCNFSTALQKKTGASIILNHHIVKDSYDGGLKVVKDDPFYGSQWLKAHVTGSYLMEETDDGRKFTNKKDSHSNLIKKFETVWDSETMTASTKVNTLPLHERAKHFCNSMKMKNEKFTEKTFREYLGCAPTTSREIFRTPPFDVDSKKIHRHKSNGNKTLYEVLELM
jgi:hypothetical protein